MPPPHDGDEEDLLEDELLGESPRFVEGAYDDEDGLLGDEDLLEDGEEQWVEVGEDGAPGFRAALFSSQAARYAAFRPSYPEHVGAAACAAAWDAGLG